MRAAAGGVVVHATAPSQATQPPVVAAEDPMAILAQLKKLREAELITEDDFAAKKAEVLARL